MNPHKLSTILSGVRYDKGLSVSEWLIYGLMGAVLMISLYAVFGSVSAQRRVADSMQGWYENQPGYTSALAEQKKSGKPVLVYIYATWCPHCKKFAANVLSTKKVQEFVKQYPHVRIEPDHGAAERALMDEFGAKAFPSFYAVTPDGQRHEIETHILEENGYRPKTPDEFIASIQEVAGEPEATEESGGKPRKKKRHKYSEAPSKDASGGAGE